jgi:hypothetical protein
MGSATQALKNLTGADTEEKAMKERLNLLLLAAKAKLRSYTDEINEMFMNPGLIDKTEIPGIRAIRFIEQYHVAAKSSFSQTVGDHLTNAIDAFFSIGGKDQDTKDAVKGGIKALISTALASFIGSTEVGESEQKVYLIIPENNAFVRVDIACWKYVFDQQKITHEADTSVAYLLCKSVIDHSKVTIDELIYLVSESLNDRNPFAKMLNVEGKDIFVKTDTKGDPIFKPNATDPNKIESYQLVPLDGHGANHNDPPSIGVVEAYIEELIRVWNKLKDNRG